MDFEKLEQLPNVETGEVSVTLAVSGDAVSQLLAEFYSAIAPVVGKCDSDSWDAVDEAAIAKVSSERYREMRRDPLER